MKKRYSPQEIEKKWQRIWQEKETFEVDLNKTAKPYYNLMMFPYPSAEGLHVGNMYAFTGSDIWGRFMRFQGWDVFEPIGLDGFGIHSENYALKVGRHPAEQAKISEKRFYQQLRRIGNQFSWQNKLETYDPSYYRWTQWIFIQLFKAGLAYRAKAPVNWCPSCKTVLADEQVIQEKCERCGSEVEQKELEQWFFRITDYAQRLLNNLEKIDWSAKVKIAQKNWLGRKEGIEIDYPLIPGLSRDKPGTKVTCFTTRPDTNFGATFVVLAPEHPLVNQIVSKDNKKAVSKYVARALRKSKKERIAEGLDKSGVFTGRYCLSRLTGKKMPIWVSDFVLGEVGSGAVVGVPGHDKRDFQFAQKFNLPIIRVVVGRDGDRSAITKIDQVQEEEGKMVNSKFLNGLDIHQATKRIMDYLEEKGWGKKKVVYHLRDWLISRQRYWSPPIPMIFCPRCAKQNQPNPGVWLKSDIRRDDQTPGFGRKKMAGWYPVSEEDLPVLLPRVKDWRPKGEGRGPLAQLEDWVRVKCPHCGGPARRETDVSDTFLDSAWYFLRYPSVNPGSTKPRGLVEKPYKAGRPNPGVWSVSDTGDKNRPWDEELTRKWLPVKMYIGGAEHSVLHLLYSRFLTMVFHDLGYLDFEEPFTKFRAHGLIIKNGAKMSKSKGNVINPDKYIAKYGADTLRCYLMFLGPLSAGGDFRDSGMAGMFKFLARVYLLCRQNLNSLTPRAKSRSKEVFWRHLTIKKVEERIKKLKYNTALAALMEYVNFLQQQKKVSRQALETLIVLLAPFAPHLTEEIWQELGQKDSVHKQKWPKYNPRLVEQKEVEILVQVNGKLRGKIKSDSELARDKKAVLKLARKSTKVQASLQGKKIKKTFFVKGKLINLVTD